MTERVVRWEGRGVEGHLWWLINILLCLPCDALCRHNKAMFCCFGEQNWDSDRLSGSLCRPEEAQCGWGTACCSSGKSSSPLWECSSTVALNGSEGVYLKKTLDMSRHPQAWRSAARLLASPSHVQADKQCVSVQTWLELQLQLSLLTCLRAPSIYWKGHIHLLLKEAPWTTLASLHTVYRNHR